MVDHDIFLVLIGAGIALLSSLVTLVLQHFLSLRAERKKFEWELKAKEEEEREKVLLSGVTGTVNLETKVRRAIYVGDLQTSGIRQDVDAKKSRHPETPEQEEESTPAE